MSKKVRTKKKPYDQPKVEVIVIEYENSIAVGSANVTPPKTATKFTHEWEQTEEITRDFTW